MVISGQVIRKSANPSKKDAAKTYYSIAVADESLRTNEGVVSVDVSAGQFDDAVVG